MRLVQASTPPPEGEPMSEAVKVTKPSHVLAIVCAGICLANLDLLIVNVALPNIAHDFGDAGLDDLSWILNGYAIVYAALLVFFGRLAERHRRDLSFLLGIAIFTAASAGCGVGDGGWALVGVGPAPGVASLVFYPLAQAAGAALMTPTSLVLLLAS